MLPNMTMQGFPTCDGYPLGVWVNKQRAKKGRYPDKPSYTVTGRGGGGTHMYHWEENRALKNRERARLQTFPNWYTFSGSKESIRKQIGMAIPPNGMKVICGAVLPTLNKGTYDCVVPNLNVQSILDVEE